MANGIDIVIPSAASKLEKFAGEEMAYFLKLASGLNGKVIMEDEYYEQGEKVVFIGRTIAFDRNFTIKNLNDITGFDGYRIVIREKEIFICGGADQGTVYGVYRALKELFNLVIYTKDCFTYDMHPLNFPSVYIEEKPDIPMRALGIYPVHLERRDSSLGDKKYCYRMRLRQMDEGWGINNHSYFRILPPEVYKEKHPEWYDASGKMLCMSNEEGIIQFAENMKKFIEEHPDDQLFMLGMEDTLEYCKCPECTKIAEKYGGFTGLMLNYTNRIVDILNRWLEEVHPERQVYFYMFAYQWAIVPPVKKTEDGKYVFLYEELRPADNLGVLIAPLLSSATYAMNDPRNYVALSTNFHGDKRISLIDVFEGWRAVVKHIAVWTYNHNFYDYFTPTPMWNGMADNIRWFKKLNAYHVFIEAGIGTKSNFAAMKIFVASNLLWDSSYQQDDLIRQFMKVYYAGADKEIYGYFTYIHKHAEWLNENLDRQQIFVHFDDEPNKRWLDRRFWPKSVLLDCLKFFDDALNKNITEKVRNRVRLEAMPVQFSLLYLYRKELDKDFVLSLIDYILESARINEVTWVCDEAPNKIQDFCDMWKKEIVEGKCSCFENSEITAPLSNKT